MRHIAKSLLIVITTLCLLVTGIPLARAGIYSAYTEILQNSEDDFILYCGSRSEGETFAYTAPPGYEIITISWDYVRFPGNEYHTAEVFFKIDGVTKRYENGYDSDLVTLDGGTWSNLSANKFEWELINTSNPTVYGGIKVILQSTEAYASTEDLTPIETAANNAKLSADSAKTYSKDAFDILNNSSYGLVELKNTVNNLQTSITNIQNTISAGDTQPPRVLEARGLNGATCTTNSTFDVVVDAEDNISSSGSIKFRVKADSGTWSGWVPITESNTATGISGFGIHSMMVEVRDEAGNISSKNITVFRL